MMESLTKLLGFLRVFKFIIPPDMHDNGETSLIEKSQRYPIRVRRWQWSVFVSLVLLMISLSINAVFSWGYEPYIRQGFVRKADYQTEGAQMKSDMTQSLASIQRIEIRLLEKDLLDTRIGQCQSRDKQYFASRLQELIREYGLMVNSGWRIPDCSEVIDP